MATQNVTLSLPKELLLRLKVIAAQRGTSVSRMLTESLRQIATRDDDYERAKKRHLALLKRAWKLGTGGQATWTRDELHDRKL